MYQGFRSSEIVKSLASKISEFKLGEVKIIHVCGTHEVTIVRSGIRHLLPENIKLIAGPGCPVCVTPQELIDFAIELSSQFRILTFGDMLRVPGREKSLEEARAEGKRVNVRIVNSFGEAVKIASSSDDEYVFFGVGFETTACITAAEIANGIPKNLSILTSYRLIPPVMEFLAGVGRLPFQGFIAPGHVSTIIGCKPYEFLKFYKIPTAIAGFEPLDVLLAVYQILKQLCEGNWDVINEYSRSVKYDGNVLAQKYMEEVFDVVDGNWRGIGIVPNSSLELKEKFREIDAKRRYGYAGGKSAEIGIKPGCLCHHVILGRVNPTDCPMFMKSCIPQKPYGPCMVSFEGTCSVWARHSFQGF